MRTNNTWFECYGLSLRRHRFRARRQLAARRHNHNGWAKFRIKNLVLIYIPSIVVYLWCYGTGTGKYRAGSTGFPWQIPEGHMCLRSSDMAQMDPSAADMALAVWNGYVQDARRHARQWRPVEQSSRIARTWVSELVAEAGRFYVGLRVYL